MILAFLAGLFAYVMFELAWFGVIMASFYKEAFGYHISVVGGWMHINYLPALLTYTVMAAGVLIFVLRGKSTTSRRAILWGALFGFLIYGAYNLTNASVLTQYPWRLVLTDTLWGAVVTGMATFVMNTVLLRKKQQAFMRRR